MQIIIAKKTIRLQMVQNTDYKSPNTMLKFSANVAKQLDLLILGYIECFCYLLSYKSNFIIYQNENT